MRLKRLMDGLSRNKGGIALLSGMAAVLEGVERLLAPDNVFSRRMVSCRKPIAPTPHEIPLNRRTDYFSIRRTKSDLGYVYWVLQGHGYFASFALFDTWSEAIDEANQRTAALPVRARASGAEYSIAGS